MNATAKATVAAIDNIEADAFEGDEVGRLAVVSAAKKLLARIQTPTEQVMAYAFEHPVIFAALQILRDLGIWQAWSVSSGDKTVDELAEMAEARVDTNLLRELMFPRRLAEFTC
jgi:fumagillin biosynthesis methyltransferase